jgi:hypothetical protein
VGACAFGLVFLVEPAPPQIKKMFYPLYLLFNIGTSRAICVAGIVASSPGRTD